MLKPKAKKTVAKPKESEKETKAPAKSPKEKVKALAYDAKIIDELKELLIEKKNSLIEKLYKWEDTSSPSGLKEVGDIADIASEINEEVLTAALTENEIDTLKRIEKALEKVDQGTYGICEGTGKKIPLTRLRAIPWTPYTVEYAEEVSKHKHRPQMGVPRNVSISGGFSMIDMDQD